MTETNSLCYRAATDLVRAMRQREIAIAEVMEAFLARIAEVNPQVNAIVTLLADEAGALARAWDAEPDGSDDKPLFGLPIAVKDLALTKGIRTTFGSPIYRDFVPDVDELFVERLKAAGAIIIGKTNTPEFGAGSQTFNTVFGVTRNPYDLDRTCGGSSGGAAAALACGMVPLADGSDLGGSLRNPASFCNVVGFRPTPGRVPSWPKPLSSDPLGVNGPMARSVEDLRLLLSVMAGPDPRVPISLQEPGAAMRGPLAAGFKGARVAWSPDLGRYEVDREVTAVLQAQLREFEALGCVVALAEPDLSDVDDIFQIPAGVAIRGAVRHDLHSASRPTERHHCLEHRTGPGAHRRRHQHGGGETGAAHRTRRRLFRRVRLSALPERTGAAFFDRAGMGDAHQRRRHADLS